MVTADFLRANFDGSVVPEQVTGLTASSLVVAGVVDDRLLGRDAGFTARLVEVGPDDRVSSAKFVLQPAGAWGCSFGPARLSLKVSTLGASAADPALRFSASSSLYVSWDPGEPYLRGCPVPPLSPSPPPPPPPATVPEAEVVLSFVVTFKTLRFQDFPEGSSTRQAFIDAITAVLLEDTVGSVEVTSLAAGSVLASVAVTYPPSPTSVADADQLISVLSADRGKAVFSRRQMIGYGVTGDINPADIRVAEFSPPSPPPSPPLPPPPPPPSPPMRPPPAVAETQITFVAQFSDLGVAGDDILKQQFIGEYVDSLEDDFGRGAVVEVKEITADGDVITQVTFPAGPSGSSSTAAEDAEAKLGMGLGGLGALSSNPWISQLGVLSLDPESVSSASLSPDTPVEIFFEASFSNLDALVRAEGSPLRQEFIRELESSLEQDLGGDVEVVEITPEGRVISSVKFPAGSVYEAKGAQDKLFAGARELSALSANSFLSSFGVLSLDSAAVSTAALIPPAPPPLFSQPPPPPPQSPGALPPLPLPPPAPAGRTSSQVWLLVVIMLLLAATAVSAVYLMVWRLRNTYRPRLHQGVWPVDPRSSTPPGEELLDEDEELLDEDEDEDQPVKTVVQRPVARTILKRIGKEEEEHQAPEAEAASPGPGEARETIQGRDVPTRQAATLMGDQQEQDE